VHSQLLPFIGTAILIALTPGADTALVVRNALVAGAPSARRTALGHERRIAGLGRRLGLRGRRRAQRVG
jgi:threonine/homoserine/homoserine lactone efflux protein